MPTVDEIVMDLLGSSATDAAAPLAARWVDQRYKELVSKVRFRHLRKVGELSLPGVITTGTVTISRGSTTLTGVSTTFQTDMSLGAQQYYYFRGRVAWYKVASVASELSLTLDSPFAEDNLAGGPYYIVKRIHPLITTSRWFQSFVHTRLRRPLELISLDEMDIRYPGRILANVYPFAVAEVGSNSAGVRTVEVYPPPSVSEILHYIYWDLPSSLSMGSTIPPVIDAHILKSGAYADFCRWKMSKALDEGKSEVAGVWRNESRAQETVWKTMIADAHRTSKGVEDVTLILNMKSGQRTGYYNDMRSAHDIVYNRWSYPQ